jgi:hypothetical protein
MKRKVIICSLLLFVCCLLSTCISPYSGETATIIINLGASQIASRATAPYPPQGFPGSPQGAPSLSDIEYIIKLGNQIILNRTDTPETNDITGNQYVEVTATVGQTYIISVRAYYNNIIYATGSNSVTVGPGSNLVSVFMNEAWTVSFDFNDGATSSINVYVGNGEPITKPDVPIRANNVSGLYLGVPPDYTFSQWLKPDNTPWNFDNDTVTESVTLTAQWSAPVPIVNTGTNNLAAAIAYINNASNPTGLYTMLLDNDITVGPQSLIRSNVTLIMNSIGDTERNINLSTVPNVLITVGSPGLNNVELVLGNNITLRGHSSPNNIELVRASAGGQITMQNGSRITGNTGTDTAGNRGDPVRVDRDDDISSLARLIMEDGAAITGNNNTVNNIGTQNANAVFVGRGIFIMKGGDIAGNIGGNNTVYLSGSGVIELSGNASFPTLVLNINAADPASNSPDTPHIFINDNWTGEITTLYLRGGYSDNVANARTAWNGRQLLNGTILPFSNAVINSFTNKLFISTIDTTSPAGINNNGVVFIP